MTSETPREIAERLAGPYHARGCATNDDNLNDHPCNCLWIERVTAIEAALVERDQKIERLRAQAMVASVDPKAWWDLSRKYNAALRTIANNQQRLNALYSMYARAGGLRDAVLTILALPLEPEREGEKG